MNHEIDARGLPCPQPVIAAKKALKDTSHGSLTVTVDNEMAVQNLMKLGDYLELNTKSEIIGEKEYRVVYTIDEQVDPSAGQEKSVSSNIRKGTVVVLSSDRMGEGEEALGKILMKGFIYALTELEKLPEVILLYNKGAGLSCENSASLEDLQQLESQGVRIMTCGTCLDYYGLSGKLKTGAVTNMYEIAEVLTGASFVVKP